MELWIKCEHGSLVRHGVPPEGTKPGAYTPANKLVWCPGPSLVDEPVLDALGVVGEAFTSPGAFDDWEVGEACKLITEWVYE